MAHTRGPWMYDSSKESITSSHKVAPYEGADEEDFETQDVFCLTGACGDNAVENIKLTIAAPEMLIKLKQCINAIESSGKTEDSRGVVYKPEIGKSFLDTIYRVIKKAEGL